MDITILNLVNQNTQVIPNYDLSGRETSISIYFNNDNDVIIVGEVDPNYIYWASTTKIYEKEKMKKYLTISQTNRFFLYQDQI